jgi:hypothetical protein
MTSGDPIALGTNGHLAEVVSCLHWYIRNPSFLSVAHFETNIFSIPNMLVRFGNPISSNASKFSPDRNITLRFRVWRLWVCDGHGHLAYY